MRTLARVFFLSAAAAPAVAASPHGAPMTEPPPRMVAPAASDGRHDRTARPPSMGESTHAIMMPGQDMPRPTPLRSVRSKRPGAPARPPS